MAELTTEELAEIERLDSVSIAGDPEIPEQILASALKNLFGRAVPAPSAAVVLGGRNEFIAMAENVMGSDVVSLREQMGRKPKPLRLNVVLDNNERVTFKLLRVVKTENGDLALKEHLIEIPPDVI